MKLKMSSDGKHGVRAIIFMLATLASSMLNSCGPVNQKPAVDLSKASRNMCDPQVPTELSANPTASSSPSPASASVSYSQDQQFIVSMQLADVDNGQSPNDQPTPMTDNLYVIRFVNGKNLSVPSANAQLTITDIHTTSTQTYNYPLDVARQGDHFITTIHFGQSGNYAIHLHLTDGAIQDDHVVYVNP
jgi:hypothetical protein